VSLGENTRKLCICRLNYEVSVWIDFLFELRCSDCRSSYHATYFLLANWNESAPMVLPTIDMFLLWVRKRWSWSYSSAVAFVSFRGLRQSKETENELKKPPELSTAKEREKRHDTIPFVTGGPIGSSGWPAAFRRLANHRLNTSSSWTHKWYVKNEPYILCKQIANRWADLMVWWLSPLYLRYLVNYSSSEAQAVLERRWFRINESNPLYRATFQICQRLDDE